MAYKRGDLERARNERDDNVRALLAQGLSLRQVAASPVTTVRQVRRQRDETIRALHHQGWSQQMIADNLGCSRSTVSRAIKDPVHLYRNG